MNGSPARNEADAHVPVPSAAMRATIQTTGTKPPDCADKTCGDWSYEREYVVKLPVPYDRTRAYPLIFVAPGCGGDGTKREPGAVITSAGWSDTGSEMLKCGCSIRAYPNNPAARNEIRAQAKWRNAR